VLVEQLGALQRLFLSDLLKCILSLADMGKQRLLRPLRFTQGALSPVRSMST
jgi:hypothetical protein